MEPIRKLCEWMVHYLPLPSQNNELYFQIHCQLTAWAMSLGDDIDDVPDVEGPF